MKLSTRKSGVTVSVFKAEPVRDLEGEKTIEDKTKNGIGGSLSRYPPTRGAVT